MDLNGLDKFKLITYQNLDLDERNVFTLLYQPIIGCDAFTLYLTLWSFIDRTRSNSTEHKHYKIYDILRMSPKQFTQARKKLEAIGLLVAYHNEDLYLYELKAPLSAEEFIKDGSLGAYLYSKIGKENFEDLVNLFRVTKGDKNGFKNITSNFDEVFSSIPQPIDIKHDYASKSKAKIKINHNFDFEVFVEGLSKNYVDRRKLTKSVIEKIMNISYVYNLDEFTMQKVFMDSVDRDRNINIEKISYNARKWFEFERETVETELIIDSKERLTPEDLLEKCKTETPSTVLGILSNGKPSVTELKVVERIIENYDFKIEVVNFLLVYVIGLLGEFPAYGYFDKVAIEWQRNNVKSVPSAIENIKNRQRRMLNQKPRNQKAKNILPKDVKADWFDDYIKNR